jgi:hypothetical protein
VRTTASEVQILGDDEEIRARSLPISTRILQQMLLLIERKINAVLWLLFVKKLAQEAALSCNMHLGSSE